MASDWIERRKAQMNEAQRVEQRHAHRASTLHGKCPAFVDRLAACIQHEADSANHELNMHMRVEPMRPGLLHITQPTFPSAHAQCHMDCEGQRIHVTIHRKAHDAADETKGDMIFKLTVDEHDNVVVTGNGAQQFRSPEWLGAHIVEHVAFGDRQA